MFGMIAATYRYGREDHFFPAPSLDHAATSFPMNPTTKTHNSTDTTNQDAPLSKKAPSSPFLLVALSYLGILLLAALGFALLYWMIR